MTDTLYPGEHMLEITNTTDDLAFGNLQKPDGSLLMAPDGVCIATAAIHRNNWGGTEPRPGSIYAAMLSPGAERLHLHLLRQQSAVAVSARAVRPASGPGA